MRQRKKTYKYKTLSDFRKTFPQDLRKIKYTDADCLVTAIVKGKGKGEQPLVFEVLRSFQSSPFD